MRFFSKIQLYILGQILLPYLGGTFIFLFIFLSFQLFRLAEYFFLHDLGLDVISQIVVLMSVSLVPVIIPVAFLFAILISFGRISNDGEYIALRSIGLSWTQILTPIIGLGMISAVLVTFCTTNWVPLASRHLKSLIIKVTSSRAVASIQPGTFTEGFFDMIIFADKVNSKTNAIEKVFIFDGRRPDQPVASVAEKGSILLQRSDVGFNSRAVLKLENGSLFKTETTASDSQFINFGEYQMLLEIEDPMAKAATKPKSMTLNELEQKIQEFRGQYLYSSPLSAPYQIEWHNRFALGAGCLVFSLLGPAFGVVHSRTGRKSGILLTLVVLAGYYALFMTGSRLAETGTIAPWLAAWIANILATFIAFFRLRKL